MMNKIIISSFIASLIVILSVSYSFASISVSINTANQALPYANEAAQFTETFYETTTVDVPNADHAVVLLSDVAIVLAKDGYTDQRIIVAQDDLKKAHSLMVQAHNLGQQADSYTKAVARDLAAVK